VKLHLLVNAGLFQVAWFAAVLGGTIAALAACAVLASHAALRGNLKSDLTLAALLAALGLGLDTLWIYLGVLDYQGAVVAPFWIVALWGALGLSLNHSLGFLSRRPFWGALATALAAPVSYAAGAALGAVSFAGIGSAAAMAIVAIAWFVMFAVLFRHVVPAVNSIYQEAHNATRH